MHATVSFGMVGRVDQWNVDDFLMVGRNLSMGIGNFLVGGIGQHNVGLTRKNVSLWCGCSIPMTE